jgi:hypothetical protein
MPVRKGIRQTLRPLPRRHSAVLVQLYRAVAVLHELHRRRLSFGLTVVNPARRRICPGRAADKAQREKGRATAQAKRNGAPVANVAQTLPIQ